jgi:sugar diacid utilization regulator
MEYLFKEVVDVIVTTEDSTCCLVLALKSNSKQLYHVFDEYTYDSIVNCTNEKSITNSALYTVSYYDTRSNDQLKKTISNLFKSGRQLDNFGRALKIEFDNKRSLYCLA